MTIDWTTPLAAIASDPSAIAAELRAKVTAVGQNYDVAGHPDVMTESTAHVAWRAAMVAELTTRDNAARSVDGKPATTIDSANPSAAVTTIRDRLTAAQSSAPTAVAALIADMIASVLPTEPLFWITAYYTRSVTSVSGPGVPSFSFQFVGDIEAALVAVLAELAAYVSFV